MPLGPDPERARAARARLAALRDAARTGTEDVLACLVVTGEPRAQRVVDDWLDQVADTLRALDEVAGEVDAVLASAAGPTTAARAQPPVRTARDGPR